MPRGKIHQPRKSIQTYVPVRPNERTELYSHKELCEFASTDPRNELDELSGPLRFKKNVDKPAEPLDSPAQSRWGGGALFTFFAGATVGAALAAISMPNAGFGIHADQHQTPRLGKVQTEGLGL